MSGPIPCVIYAARSAGDDRKDEEKSTTSQTAEVRERIEQEGGRLIVGEFAESGHSGFHGERGPELAAAMQRAKEAAAEFDGEAELWVFHSSRLSRGDGSKGRQGLMKIWADLKYEDVQVRSVSDDEFVKNPMLVGIASETNRKYSADHGAHVARGKKTAVENGRWPGGPIPDGYLAERSIDERGRKQVALVIDEQRAPIIRLMFDMSEEGLGDPTIARRLNENGYRTLKGRPWTRRLVQHRLGNHVYAGRTVRWGEGARRGGDYERLKEPEVFPGLHPALIEPNRFDRIYAARASRDRRGGAGDRKKRGGRPTTRYALAKLAVCDRCGERMYCNTNGYRREDGSQRRTYRCANYHGATGLCDQPPIDAEMVDGFLLVFLEDLVLDVDAWAAELAKGAEEKRAGLESLVAAERKKIEKTEKTYGKVKARWIKAVDSGKESEAELANEAMGDLKAETEMARADLKSLLDKLDALENEPTPTDAALDLYSELANAVRSGGRSIRELNERLREQFEEFRLDQPDPDSVSVQPVLKPVEAPLGYMPGDPAIPAVAGKRPPMVAVEVKENNGSGKQE
jgi:DNA invertase Pin-like site-specific DNA recombinase